jgi:hypothetical protein
MKDENNSTNSARARVWSECLDGEEEIASRDLGDVVFWGPNLAKACNMFGYDVGIIIVVGIVKS